MDILGLGVKKQHRFWARFLLYLIYFLFKLCTPQNILINAIACNAAILELLRRRTSVHLAILGGLQDPVSVIKKLSPNPILAIAGNHQEQLRYSELLKSYEREFLPYSQNTLQEAQSVIEYARHHHLRDLGICMQEFHCTRAAATFIQQTLKKGLHLIVVPIPSLDSGREGLMPALCELAVLVEAWKLWLYQKKGDVATLKSLIGYVRHLQTQKS